MQGQHSNSMPKDHHTRITNSVLIQRFSFLLAENTDYELRLLGVWAFPVSGRTQWLDDCKLVSDIPYGSAT